MGLSSSQARLLSLTGRMHDIEYKAQHLEAQKLQMANESAHVYQEYENALNATKIQLKQINSDGSDVFIDATYNAMKKAGYIMKFKDDYKPIISAATESNYIAAGTNRNYFIALENGRVTTSNQTVGDVTEIYSAAQLQSMSSTGKYRLMSNIDMSRIDWTPKSFNGTFDGNGYSITGLNNALFSNINGGRVENLSIQCDTTSSQGILANTINNATIKNISVTGKISVTGNINSSSSNVGGLVGTLSGTSFVENCSADVIINSSSNNVGGLIGLVAAYSNGTIRNCTTTGDITAMCNMGGAIGCIDGNGNTKVEKCTSSANVHAMILDDPNLGSTSCAGGFIGAIISGTISNCEATGDVTARGNVIGGFAGAGFQSAKISNCIASGDVTGNIYSEMQDTGYLNAYTAGFICAINGVTVENCDAYGTATFDTDFPLKTSATSFGSVNMSATPRTGKISNCYAATTSNDTPFTLLNHKLASEPTESSSANNTSVVVTPPSININETINDTAGAGIVYDEISKYGGYILEGTTVDNVRGNGNNSTWFTNMVNAGLLFIFKNDSEGNEYQVNVATDTGLQEVSNDVDLKKAEAKYEADMRKINSKDKKFDTDLAALEQERNAIKTEMDTLKSVAKDNVDRTFKLFS